MLLQYTPETHSAYYELLNLEAEDNAWSKKADAILEMLAEYESAV